MDMYPASMQTEIGTRGQTGGSDGGLDPALRVR